MFIKKFRFAILALLLIFGTILIGCSNDVEPTFTVWTETTSYAEFQSVFGPLNDGFYIRIELTVAEFNLIRPDLSNEFRRNWTEDQIFNWFIGRGFGHTEARQETSWLLTINHGFIASRSGQIVHMLIK